MTGPAAAADRITVKVMSLVPALPSCTDTSAMDRLGIAGSAVSRAESHFWIALASLARMLSMLSSASVTPSSL